jgi:alkylhydroperoxidase family enzyme
MEVPFNETDAAEGLSEKEKAVLAYTDAMTREIKVSDECFARVRRLFSEREVVELTACVAGYNCVSRFLVALDVGENNGKRMKGVDELVAELGEGERVVSR